MSKVEHRNYYSSEYQKELWNRQHAERGGDGGLENLKKFDPNGSAIQFGNLINKNSNILEIGSGNGRDARYWASEDHCVTCVDFSEVALRQLNDIAQKQKVSHKIIPVLHDINSGDLPIDNQLFDGFYARSSLHVEDDKIINIVKKVDSHLNQDAVILIMGKSLDDTKIQRSVIDGSLAIDIEENGHLRRIWTEDFMEKMCKTVSWNIYCIDYVLEKINNYNISFIKLIAKKNG